MPSQAQAWQMSFLGWRNLTRHQQGLHCLGHTDFYRISTARINISQSKKNLWFFLCAMKTSFSCLSSVKMSSNGDIYTMTYYVAKFWKMMISSCQKKILVPISERLNSVEITEFSYPEHWTVYPPSSQKHRLKVPVFFQYAILTSSRIVVESLRLYF